MEEQFLCDTMATSIFWKKFSLLLITDTRKTNVCACVSINIYMCVAQATGQKKKQMYQLLESSDLSRENTFKTKITHLWFAANSLPSTRAGKHWTNKWDSLTRQKKCHENARRISSWDLGSIIKSVWYSVSLSIKLLQWYLLCYLF